MHFFLSGLNCRYSHSCLALFYVRNELQKNLPESQVTLRQFTLNDPYYNTLLKISGSGADALFFSVYIWNADYIERLIVDLAEIVPDIPIILGGPQAGLIAALPKNCTIVDGEIEGMEQDFYIDLADGKLKPLYLAASGRPFHAPYQEMDFAGELKNRQVYYESSRGCPFRCSYCLSSISKGVLHLATDQVRREIDFILPHQPKIIKFVDRTFNDNTDRALEIWRYLSKKETPTRFHFEITPDRFTEEMFVFLENVAPDRFQFEIGIQSTNEKTLNAINRKMDVDLAGENIRRLAGFDNVHLHVDLIIGLPFETEISFRQSFNKVFSFNPHYIQMGLLKVLPGTPISKKVKDFGMVSCKAPPYQVMANKWLDHNALSTLYVFGECVERFYNNRYFRSIWKYLRERGEEAFTFFQDLFEISLDKRYADLAPTQELLTKMLCELSGQRDDREIMTELLRYDWLRCGHHFLPDPLVSSSFSELRNIMWERLPQNIDCLYTYRDRSRFFKSVVFLRMSDPALRQVGLYSDGCYGAVCFLPQQTHGVLKHCRTILIECP